jgi:hypothetical protein
MAGRGKAIVSTGITMANNTSNKLLGRVMVKLTNELLISIAEFYDSVMLPLE